MKKLLNLFAGITLVTTTASTVVACDNNKTDPKAQNTATVNDIVTKFNNFLKSNPIIKIDSKYTNLKDPATIIALNNALATEGLQLSGNPGDPANPNVKPTGEWADLTYSGTLTAFEETSLTVNIKAGEGSSMVQKDVTGLKVQNALDKEAANNLETKIKQGLPSDAIILPYSIGNEAETAQNILNTELDTALQKNRVHLQGNPGSSGVNPTGDWSHLSWRETIPQAGTEGTIKLFITFGGEKKEIDIKVMKAKNNQQRAEALAGKIIQKEIVIPQGTPTNVDNPTTKAVLNTELQTANPTLQGNPGDGTSADPATGDFSHISYTGTLEAGKPASLAAVVQFAQTPKNLYGDPYSETVNDIQATLAGTPQQILDALAGEIDTAKTIKLPYGKTYDPTNATDAASISKTLKTANPLFKLPNNVTQTFSGGKIIMENDQPITISMNLKLGATTKSVSFPVGVNNIWNQGSLPRSSGHIIRNTVASYSPVQLGAYSYFATNNGLMQKTASTGWTFNPIIDDIREGGSAVLPGVIEPPVNIGNFDYVTLNGKSNRTPAMFRSPHGKNQWSGVGNIPLNEMFQSEPVRFNFGTATSPVYKYFLMSASNSGALYTSSDGITWNRTATLASGVGAENAPTKIGNTLYVGTYYNGLWYSNNQGKTWAKYTPSQGNLPADGWINYPPEQFGDGKPFVYVQGRDASQNGVYYQNSNHTWTKNTTSGIDAEANFKSKPVAVGGKIYWQSINKGLYVSSNNGASWTQSTSEETMSGKAGQVNIINGVYYLGTDNGVYTSANGIDWTKNATGTFNSSNVVPGKIVQLDGQYQAATNSNGVWYI